MSSFEDGAKEPQRESLDLGLSNLDSESWKTESPPDLWPAIAAIHSRFEKDDDSLYDLTHKLCYAHLHHARTGELKELEECKERELVALVFRHLSHIPGACARFLATLRQAMPPAWFRAYLDAYMNLVTVSARVAFKELLEIGLENESRLSSRPVAWAEAQVKHMIRSHRNSIIGWIRGVCLDPAMTLDEQIGQQTWKAPRFIQMRPARHLPYDASHAWDLLENELSWKLVHAFADEYVLHLDEVIEEAAGSASVELAKQPVHSTKNPAEITQVPGAQPSAIVNKPKMKPTSKPLGPSQTKRRQVIFGVIQAGLRGTRYCSELDRRRLPLPLAWKDQGCPATYAQAYRDAQWRKRIQDEKCRYREQFDIIPVSEREAIIQG